MCGKPCNDCPYRRAAIPGWLGAASNDPARFIAPHWLGDLHHPCHKTVDWEKDDAQDAALHKPTCAGFAIMCKNSGKLPLNPDDAAVVRSSEVDRETVFSHIGEWFYHHGGDPMDLYDPLKLS